MRKSSSGALSLCLCCQFLVLVLGIPRHRQGGGPLFVSHSASQAAAFGLPSSSSTSLWGKATVTSKSPPFCIRDLRGGALALDNDTESEDEEEEDDEDNEEKDDDSQSTASQQAQPTQHIPQEPVPITIQTSLGNALVDQVLELNVQKSRTVASVKESVRRQLPGKPPVACMQLIVDGKALADDICIMDLLDDEDDEDDEEEEEKEEARDSVLTLTLDMIPPVDPKFMTTVEERLPDMTTSELLQAFAVNEAALLKNAVLLEQDASRLRKKQQLREQQQEAQGNLDGDMLQEEQDNDDDKEDSLSATTVTSSPSQLLYLELREEANRIRQDMEQTILATDAARKILEDDQPPSQKRSAIEVRGQRVRVPRTGGRTTMIKEKVQRNLNVQWADTIRYCVLFLFFGYFGGRTPVSRAILLLGAPSVFVLQARPVKLIIKQILYTILDHPPGIVLSLLPAPQQAILNMNYDESMKLLYSTFAEETQKIEKAEEDNLNDFFDASEDNVGEDTDDGIRFFDSQEDEYDSDDDED